MSELSSLPLGRVVNSGEKVSVCSWTPFSMFSYTEHVIFWWGCYDAVFLLILFFVHVLELKSIKH